MNAGRDTLRLAAIDVGTNAILLLIVETNGAGGFHVLEERAEVARLGEGVERNAFLGEEGQRRTLETLRGYCSRCRFFGVGDVMVVGTSALRVAVNAPQFKARLKRELGLDLRVLSPGEEARYSYLAVQRGLALEAKQCLVVDVGGGSTEFIWGKSGGLFRWASLGMGTVGLTERFLRSDPVREKECVGLVRAVDRELKRLKADWKVEEPFQEVVGVAGTFTSLVAVMKRLGQYSPSEVHGSSLRREEVQRQIGLFKGKTVAERRAIPGLEPRRADVILAGALLIDRVMESFHLESAVVSDQGVRYGILYERLDRLRGQAPSPSP